MRRLPRSFYNRDTIVVARELLGKYVVHQSRGVKRIGRIVEVEAYLGPHDLAAHSARGLTDRTKVMFGPPGHAYVYLIYGMYYCMNVVTEREGHASAVLLRALEPVKNVEGRTCGPGLLCKAMRIDKRLNAHDLLSGRLAGMSALESPTDEDRQFDLSLGCIRTVEIRREIGGMTSEFCRPCRDFWRRRIFLTARAVGYLLSPLRG